jgi:hypothetical protein
MKIKIKIKYMVFLLPLFIFGCSPDNEDYTGDWVGTWKINKDVIFPQVKSSHSGDIIKDESTSNKIIISGTLLGLNSSYTLPATVSSSTATFDKTTTFHIKGKAILYDNDSMTFKFTVTQDNITQSYVVGANKQSKKSIKK